MNILDGELKEGKLNFEDFTLPAIPRLQGYLEQHKKFKLGIRPEYLRISKKKREFWVLFKCNEIEEKGRGVRILYLKSENNQNEIKALGTFSDVSTGDKVWIQFPRDKVRIYDKKGQQITI